MLEIKQNQTNGQNGRDRANLTLLILILGILSVASIGILVLAMLRQLYPKVFAAPGIAKQLNYQGKLQDGGGNTVPDGSYAMQFTIYDSSVGGNILWTSRESDACGAPFNPAAKTISTSNGIFSTLLGETGDCSVTLDFNDDSYYLGVTVGADPEMTPRKRIGATGYAFNSDLLDGLSTSSAGGLNAYVPVTDASGNLVLSADVTFDTNTFMLDSTNDAIGIGGSPTPFAQVYVTTGKTAGLYADSSAVGGRGISGAASATTGLTAGGSFIAGPPPALLMPGADIGVLAFGSSPTQTSYGGFFSGGDYGAYGSESNAGGYGLYGSAAGSGGTGVFGQATSSLGTTYGVRGQATGTIAVNYGGYFESAGLGGYGVYGRATDATALPNYGGYFESDGTTGYGVYGNATAGGKAINYGGYFQAGGNTGYGVYGYASGLGNSNYGGYFRADGPGGYAVYANETDATNLNYGVYSTVTSPNAWAGYFVGGKGVSTDNDLFVGITAENITNAGFTMTGAGSGYFDDKLGVNGSIYTNNSFIAGASTTYSDGTITTSASDLVVTPAGGEMTVIGNIESVANTSFNPVLKGSAATGSNPVALYVSGRYAYTANSNANTLEIFDVSNPSTPAIISSVATGASPMSVYVSGRYAYVGNSGANTLEIFDVSNPSTPVSVGSAVTIGPPRSVFVSGHYAYTADSFGNTLEIFDVSNPAVPLSVGSAATGANPMSIYVSGHYAYLVNATANTLEIFDVSNPSAPVLAGSAATGATPLSVYVSGRYVYLVNITANTLEIFDVSNPSAPVLAGSAATGALPVSVFVSGRYAYVVDTNGTNKLEVFDVSNPAIPVKVGEATTGVGGYALYVSGRYAYVTNYNATNALQVFDISGLEVTSGMVHSLEAGNLQVRNDAIIQGETQVNGGLHTSGTGFFGAGIYSKNLALASSPVGQDTVVSSWQKYSETLNGSSKQYYGFFNAVESDTTNTAGETFDLFGDYTTTLFSGSSLTAASSIYGVYSSAAVASGSSGNVANSYGLYSTSYSPLAATGVITNSYGVYGNSNVSLGGGTILNSYGGYFESVGGLISNYGVYAKADNAGGVGVYGTSLLGWAGYFTGGGMGLYTDRLAVLDFSAVTYNTIGPAATSQGLSTGADLFIAGQLEVDGASWFDGGHTDLAEMINYNGKGEAGDVIVIDENANNAAKLADKPYDQNVLGIISTNPSLIITGDIKEGKLLAVAGRVPTKVSNLNGPIARGDLLTTSAKPGYAMKATEAGPIVGKALEPCDADSCTIWVFLNVSWYGGAPLNMTMGSTKNYNIVNNVISDKLTADLDANGFSINNVSKITAIGGKWNIDENGLLKSQVAFTRDNETIKKDIYALSSTGAEVVLSGSSKLDRGEILIDFSQVDKDFPEIIDETVSLKISVTPTADCQGMYVAEKYPQGFKVKESSGGTSGASFDWIVIGQRKGYGTAAEK